MNRLLPTEVQVLVLIAFCAGCSSIGSKWRAAELANTESAYREFLAQYPGSEFTDEAEDRIRGLLWERAEALNTVEGYSEFLSQFPSGAEADSSWQRVTSLVWEDESRANKEGITALIAGMKTGSIESSVDEWRASRSKRSDISSPYQLFMAKHGDNPQEAEARARASEALWRKAEEEKNSIIPYRIYLSLFPGGQHAAMASDCDAWAKAEVLETSTAYDEYLKAYPNGRFTARAKSSISSLPSVGQPVSLADRARIDAVLRDVERMNLGEEAQSLAKAHWFKAQGSTEAHGSTVDGVVDVWSISGSFTEDGTVTRVELHGNMSIVDGKVSLEGCRTARVGNREIDYRDGSWTVVGLAKFFWKR
jgi:hypothetical protein